MTYAILHRKPLKKLKENQKKKQRKSNKTKKTQWHSQFFVQKVWMSLRFLLLFEKNCECHCVFATFWVKNVNVIAFFWFFKEISKKTKKRNDIRNFPCKNCECHCVFLLFSKFLIKIIECPWHFCYSFCFWKNSSQAAPGPACHCSSTLWILVGQLEESKESQGVEVQGQPATALRLSGFWLVEKNIRFESRGFLSNSSLIETQRKSGQAAPDLFWMIFK